MYCVRRHRRYCHAFRGVVAQPSTVRYFVDLPAGTICVTDYPSVPFGTLNEIIRLNLACVDLWYSSLVAKVSLLMVWFLLGGKLTKESSRSTALDVLLISMSSVLLSVVLFSLGLICIGVPQGAVC